MARALLSDGYKRIDHLDVLTAILGGVERAGVPVQVQGCDLTERRMYVRMYSEQVVAHAPAMLAGYRSPFTGAEGAANPVVWGGLVITNSETGDGAATITPRLVVQVCRNGYTITADAHRAVHLGGKLSEGVIDWSADTQQRNLDLITAKARDAVTRFLDPAYGGSASTVGPGSRRTGQAGHGGPPARAAGGVSTAAPPASAQAGTGTASIGPINCLLPHPEVTARSATADRARPPPASISSQGAGLPARPHAPRAAARNTSAAMRTAAIAGPGRCQWAWRAIPGRCAGAAGSVRCLSAGMRCGAAR